MKNYYVVVTYKKDDGKIHAISIYKNVKAEDPREAERIVERNCAPGYQLEFRTMEKPADEKHGS